MAALSAVLDALPGCTRRRVDVLDSMPQGSQPPQVTVKRIGPSHDDLSP